MRRKDLRLWEIIHCPRCDGTGQISFRLGMLGHDMSKKYYSSCAHCHGEGVVIQRKKQFKQQPEYTRSLECLQI